MDRSKIKINESDEEDIQELAALPECPVKQRLFWHFGSRFKSCRCPKRVQLKKDIEHWLKYIKPLQKDNTQKDDDVNT